MESTTFCQKFTDVSEHSTVQLALLSSCWSQYFPPKRRGTSIELQSHISLFVHLLPPRSVSVSPLLCLAGHVPLPCSQTFEATSSDSPNRYAGCTLAVTCSTQEAETASSCHKQLVARTMSAQDIALIHTFLPIQLQADVWNGYCCSRQYSCFRNNHTKHTILSFVPLFFSNMPHLFNMNRGKYDYTENNGAVCCGPWRHSSACSAYLRSI
jgi:hypothetical protein